MKIKLQPAKISDAAELAKLHSLEAELLTLEFGAGPWSNPTSEKSMLLALRTSSVFVARMNLEIIATLRLNVKKPWAIDTSFFTPSKHPLYLLAMAVAPAHQRQGIGRQCLREAERIARKMGVDFLRLDAFDAPAGAGSFYARCHWTEVGRKTYRGAAMIYFERGLVE